jgi:hypothetical protein
MFRVCNWTPTHDLLDHSFHFASFYFQIFFNCFSYIRVPCSFLLVWICFISLVLFFKNYNFLKRLFFNTSIVTNYNYYKLQIIEIIFGCLFFVKSLHSTLPPPFVVIKYPFFSLSTYMGLYIFTNVFCN